MKSTLHEIQLGTGREKREVVIIEGCEECVDKLRHKLAALIAEAKADAKAHPCGCKDKVAAGEIDGIS